MMRTLTVSVTFEKRNLTGVEAIGPGPDGGQSARADVLAVAIVVGLVDEALEDLLRRVKEAYVVADGESGTEHRDEDAEEQGSRESLSNSALSEICIKGLIFWVSLFTTIYPVQIGRFVGALNLKCDPF